MSGSYFVYILASKRNGTLLCRRSRTISFAAMSEHKAKLVPGYTRNYGVDKLVWSRNTLRSLEARARERSLKRWLRAWKLELIEKMNPEWRDLTYDLAVCEKPRVPDARSASRHPVARSTKVLRFAAFLRRVRVSFHSLRSLHSPRTTDRLCRDGNESEIAHAPDAAARALRLLGDRRPSAAEAAGRRAAGVLDHRQLRGLGHRARDAAPGAAGARHHRAAPARRAELELARIRHAGRLLALLRALRAARHPPDARDQRARLRGLSARRRAGQATTAGSSWATPTSRGRSTTSPTRRR